MGWGAGSCHSAGWQQEPASPAGSGCLGKPLPAPGGLLSQRGTCLGPFPAAETVIGRWVGKPGGLPFSSRPSPTLTPSPLLLGGGNGFCRDKGASLSPQSTGEPLGCAGRSRGWHRAGGALPGISHFGGVPNVIPALGMAGTGLSSSPDPECDVGLLQHSVPHPAGHKEGPRCERLGGGGHSALQLPGTPLEWLQLLSQPSPMPLLSPLAHSAPGGVPNPGER